MSLIRRSVAVLDHGLLAGSTAIMTLLIARTSSPDMFGRFALVLATHATLIGLYRALAGGWILVELRRYDSSRVGTLLSGAAALSLVYGTLHGILLIGCAAWLGISDPGTLFWFFILGPAQLSVLTARMNAYRSDRPRTAAAFSAAQVTFMIVFIVMSEVLGHLGPRDALAAYALGAAIAASASLARIRPHVKHVPEFVRLGSGSWRSVTLNTLALQSRTLLYPFAVAHSGGVAETAGYRGAQTIAALPVQVPQGLQATYQAEIAGHKHPATVYVRRGPLSRWLMLNLGLMAPLFLGSWVIPDFWGRQILGESWEFAEHALPWILLGALIAQLTAGFEMILRAFGSLRAMAAVRILSLAPTTFLIVAWTSTAGATGAALALLVENVALAVCAGASVYVMQSRHKGAT